MKDRSSINEINPTFIALTVTAIRQCLSGSKTAEFTVPPHFGQAGGAQSKYNKRNIDHSGNNACTDVLCRLDADFCSSSPEVETRKIHILHNMICRRIHSTGTDRAMAQPSNNRSSIDEYFLDYVVEELIERPDNSFKRLSGCVAVTEASRQFSPVFPMGGSAIASSSQPVPCTNSNHNSNIINTMTSIENTGLVGGSTIVEGAMSLGC